MFNLFFKIHFRTELIKLYLTSVYISCISFLLGTVTNRKALINFKSGGFFPGVAVQPVVLRPLAVEDKSALSGYRAVGLDTLTWTMNQNFSPITCFWFTLCQFSSNYVVSTLIN